VTPAFVSRWLILSGYLFVAFGEGVSIWLTWHSPSQYLVFEFAAFLSYLLIGSAWWVCIAAMREVMGNSRVIGRGLALFGIASGVLFAGSLWSLWHGTGGWNIVTLGSTAIGYIGVTAGFWVATRTRSLLALGSRVPADVQA